MRLKSDVKFEEKFTLVSKIDMRNLFNFNASSCKPENLHFHVLLFLTVFYVWAITLENDAKFEDELTFTLKNDMRNLANFDPTLKTFKIFILMGSFCPKYIIFEVTKYRRVMRLFTGNQCKFWKKNDLWFHKWHEEFGELPCSTQIAGNLTFERHFFVHVIQCLS